MKQPKIYSIVLTNEKAIRSYLYILLFYDKFKLSEEELNSNLNDKNSKHFSKTFYCPISIIITSYINNIDFFRKLLTEYYSLIQLNSNFISDENYIKENKNIEKINSYQKIELLNYIKYSYELINPPPKSIFTFNLKFSSIQFISRSKEEIPTSDYCIEVLFNCLEITTIIKLFIALLFEKHVIIIANQNLTLFCICEGLRSLLFPFRWLHSFIPNLPFEQFDLLESPSPYLMGILSSFADAFDLSKICPSHIICDVGTSQLIGNVSSLTLPMSEESKIKAKLLLLKNKNNYDDIVFNGINYSQINCGILNNTDFEDVSFCNSFAQNVQNVFMRIFRNNLSNVKKEYFVHNVFDGKKFLNSFDDKEYYQFFKKFIDTLAFEFFILSMQYLDDSNSRQFNIICQSKETKFDNIKYYNYDFSLQRNLFLNNDENDKYKKHYEEISSLIDKNYEKKDNISYIINENNSNKNNNSSNYIKLKFYQKQGFLNFIHNYQNLSYPQKEILTEIIALSKDIKENTIEINRITSKTIHIPNDGSSQFYLIIAQYIYRDMTHILNMIDIEKYSYINNNFIYQLFNISYEKNRIEFPRNLFYIILGSFSKIELKNLLNTSHKYFNKTIACQLRKMENVKYKTMVISHDSDDERSILDDEDFNNFSLGLKRIKSTKNKSKDKNKRKINEYKKSLCKIDDKIVYDDENYKKMKINVIDGNNNISKENSLTLNHPYNIKTVQFSEIKNYYPSLDPIIISENICTKLYSLLTKYKIEKFSDKYFDTSSLRDLSNTDEFIEVKNLILSLKGISLEKLTNKPNFYYCFWLNLYNFLTIFAIIYKCEQMSNYYEWYRFLKNSYYTIGNCEISLYEIENVILRKNEISKRIYKEIIKEDSIKNLPLIKKFNQIINFGISIPTNSSPSIRIYFPYNFIELLRLNGVEFFSRLIKIDLKNFVIELPEYLIWIDPNFIDNIENYRNMLPSEFIDYVCHNNSLSKLELKFDWKITFENLKNVQNL